MSPEGSELLDVDCPVRTLLDHVVSRWGSLVICALSSGPMRFGALRATVGGISDKMLSQHLKVLAADGFVERVVDTGRPPGVTYQLTPDGHELGTRIQALLGWLVDHQKRTTSDQH